jgi:hypothetical protein
MNKNENMIEAHKSISKVNVGLLVIIIFFCIYLLQRSFITISYAPNLLISKEKQYSNFGLELSYQALTYLWPILLGALCIIYSFLISKQILIFSFLKQNNPNLSTEELSVMDAFLITPTKTKFKRGRLIYFVLSISPLIVSITHLVSIIVSSLIFAFSPRLGLLFTDSGFQLFFSFLGILLSSIFGFWAALLFRNTMNVYQRTYDNSSIA